MKLNITNPVYRVRILDYPPREYNVSTRSYNLDNFNYRLRTHDDWVVFENRELYVYTVELFAV